MKCCEMSRARERYPSSSQQTTCMRGRRIRCWLGQPRGALREGNDHSMRCAQKKSSHHDRERGKTTIPPTSPAAARKPRERKHKHHTVEETRAIYQKGSAMARRGNRTPPPAGKGALPSSGRASQEKAGDGANSLSGGGPFRIYDDGGIPPNRHWLSIAAPRVSQIREKRDREGSECLYVSVWNASGGVEQKRALCAVSTMLEGNGASEGTRRRRRHRIFVVDIDAIRI